ncbi:MAG: tyrosine-type recombinase/integrase [Deltaproteobacteria bacterium]|nr:tyrosine-type recombinase/integrase [Deltaproteobacteria bacterium]MDZ4344772.1 tyrosine-type recombinase/integrase [Candidatus Binatia bacterium]
MFARPDGRPLDPNDLRRQIFYKALSLAGMRRVRFHDLRHSFASLLIGQGENLVYIKDQLGHASIQMTVDTYGHLIPSSNRIAVDKLDHMASGESPAESGSKTVAGDHRTQTNYA